MHGHFEREKAAARCRYAALSGGPARRNIEDFFHAVPAGLGFLLQDQQIWAAGSLGPAVHADLLYKDYLSADDARYPWFGYVQDAAKPTFFVPASCVLVAATAADGARAGMADAIASGHPVITTPHGVEGYGPPLLDDEGIHAGELPRAVKDLVRRALREGLPS